MEQNPFDQFDDPRPTANAFDQFDQEPEEHPLMAALNKYIVQPNAAELQRSGDVLSGIQHGLTLGLDTPANAAIGTIKDLISQDPDTVNQIWNKNYAKFHKLNSEAKQRNPALYATGQAAGNIVPMAAAAPELAASDAVKATLPDATPEFLANAVSSPTAQAMASGAALGGGAAGVQELADTGDVKKATHAADVAALVGAAIPGAASGLGYLGEKVGQAAGSIGIGPKTNVSGVSATQQQLDRARDVIQNAASDPDAVRAALENGTAEMTNARGEGLGVGGINGSEPTTYEAIGGTDAGIGGLTRVAANRNTDFQARTQAQNEARNAVIEGLQEFGTAEPTRVSELFNQHLDDLTATGQQAIQARRSVLQQHTAGLGADNPNELELAGQRQRESLQTGLSAAKGDLSNPAPGSERQLWSLVDPNGDLTVSMDNTAGAAQRLQDEHDPDAGDVFSPRVRSLLDASTKLQGLQPFGRLQKLLSNVSTAQREAANPFNPDGQALRQLTILKGGINQDLDDIISTRVAAENAAVKAGQMQPQQTLAAQLAADRDTWYAARSAGEVQAGSQGNAAVGEMPTAAVSGVRSPPPMSSGQAAGDTAVETGTPFSEEDADALAAARAKTAEIHNIWGQKDINAALATDKSGNPSVPAGNITQKFFGAGASAPEKIDAYLTAGGDADALSDGAIADLRAKATNPDGTLNPARFNSWMQRNRAALNHPAFEDLTAQLGDVASAQSSLDGTIADHLQTIKDYQNSAVKSFLGSNDTPTGIRKIFTSANPADTMQGVVDQIGDDPDALAGLRRGVVDYMQQNYRNAQGVFQPDKFQKFIAKNSDALGSVFGDEGLQNIEMVGADINRSQKIQNTKIPGQSNTPQDLAGAQKFTQGTSLLGSLARMEAAGAVGEGIGGFLANAVPGARAVGRVAGAVYSGAKQLGAGTVNDLVDEAMLHPEIAKVLLSRVSTPTPPIPLQQKLARAMQSTVSAQLAQ